MHVQHGDFGLLTLALVLLVAAVASVPIARRLGLSAIVAYLIAGIVIGPYGLGVFATPERIIPVAELGVVMLLFLIGLELELGRLIAMRRDIFGLGAAQLALTAIAIGALAYATGLLGWRGAIVAGLALAMSATAIALQILEERGQLQQDYGQRAFAILLFQDIAVVPLLACVPLLAPGSETSRASLTDGLLAVGCDRRRDRADRCRRPLPAQSVLPAAGADRLARGDDRGGAAGRARRGSAHAGGRHVDGARRLPGRRAARRIELSARARSRHRAVPRPPARRCSSWASA